jgi:hypothetical protein
MPPKRGKASTKPKPRTSEEEVTAVDVQYNPDIIAGMLQDLELDVDSRCMQIQKEIDFMATSIQQAFHLELIKLPTQVKQMSLSKFKQEFGDNLETVTKVAIAGTTSKSRPVSTTSSRNAPMSAVKTTRNNSVFQTPSNPGKTSSLMPGTAMRAPREGEIILSSNGSPLGEFATAVKAPRIGKSALGLGAPSSIPDTVPQTPGYLTLQTGDVVALDDVETLPEEMKDDALAKMQAMMENMQAMMSKLKQPGAVGGAAAGNALKATL